MPTSHDGTSTISRLTRRRWLLLASALALSGARAGTPAARASGIAVVVAVGAGLVAAARIPVTTAAAIDRRHEELKG